MRCDLAVSLLLFSFPWLSLCSEQPCTPECYQSLELTKESLVHFTAHLANGPTDSLVIKLQKWLPTHWFYQKLCLKYLIGSVAVFGKADERGLNTIHGFCNKERILYLSDLSYKLLQKNNSDTVALFAAENISSSQFANLFKDLMKEYWDAMEGLTTNTMRVLKKDTTYRNSYRFILRYLPAERRYQMAATGEVSLEVVGGCYYREKDDPSLREMFFLARCSHNPNPEIRRFLVSQFASLKGYLADDNVMSNTKDPCPKRIPVLNDDVLCHISRFMDTETLVYMMPLVCRTWRNLYWRIVIHDTRIHDLYLHDLSCKKLHTIHRMVPWRYFLQNEADAEKYFGNCIEGGAFNRISPFRRLRHNMEQYLEAVIEGRAPLPRIEGCSTQYDTFVKLFEEVCNLCGTDGPTLSKPEFFTDGEYERVIYYFVYERRWTLSVSYSLISDNMPRLFSIVKEDEELMEKLVNLSFGGFYDEASLALIMCGQKSRIPDKLARLILSRSSSFERLIEPKVVACEKYYSSIVELGILPRVIKNCRIQISILFLFLTSVIISFKDNADMIDRIVASMASKCRGRSSPKLQEIKQWLDLVPIGKWMAATGYSTGDVELFKGVMVRCGLL